MGLLLVRIKRSTPGSARLPNKVVPLPVELSICARGVLHRTSRSSRKEIGDWHLRDFLTSAQLEDSTHVEVRGTGYKGMFCDAYEIVYC